MPSQTILADQAILPDSLRPQPATIVFDTDSGIITSVTPGIHQGKGEADVWEIEEEKVLLPGLIEYVHYPLLLHHLILIFFLVAHTSTSTNPGVPPGKVSVPAHLPPFPAVSPRLSTCLSILSLLPPRSLASLPKRLPPKKSG